MFSRLLEFLGFENGWQVFRAVLDIAVVSYVIYRLILLAKGKRAWWILIGLGIFFVLLLVSQVLELVTLNWILRQVLPLGPVAIFLLFYPELRELLEKMGRAEFFGASLTMPGVQVNVEQTVDVVVRTAAMLSPYKIGALIVLERETQLDEVIATGTLVDAVPSPQLLNTIFYHGTPLHDGAVVIRAGRVAAAECRLPLSETPNITGNVHMRHRAALGLAESCDAVVVVVSEETGTISIAMNGKLQRGLNPDKLREKLLEAFGRGKTRGVRSGVGSFPFLRRREDPPTASQPAKGTP